MSFAKQTLRALAGVATAQERALIRGVQDATHAERLRVDRERFDKAAEKASTEHGVPYDTALKILEAGLNLSGAVVIEVSD